MSSSCRLEIPLSVSVCAQDKLFHQSTLAIEGFAASKNTEEPKDPAQTMAPSASALGREINSTERKMVAVEPAGSRKAHQCVVWCSCVCRSRRSFKSPWLLENLIGEIGIRYSSQLPLVTNSVAGDLQALP